VEDLKDGLILYTPALNGKPRRRHNVLSLLVSAG
jgi:hypothetical protein